MALFDRLSRQKPYAHQGAHDEEALNWLQLIRSDGIGPVTFYKLIAQYGDAQTALEALPSHFKKDKNNNRKIAQRDACMREVDTVQKRGGRLICAFDRAYPLALSAIDDAPPVLSVIGHSAFLNQNAIGIVGARNASFNAQKFTKTLAVDLGQEEQIIVSGLARGIDTAAHEGALKSGTVADVAGGVDIIYPRENKKLYEQIAAEGCIVAESPLGMQPAAQHFPRRNRIISGLSAGVIVVEANLRSGSLITARLAAEQGRDVFAVPGFPRDPRAEGPNKLLKDGAVLVRNAQDVLETVQNFGGIAPPHKKHADTLFTFDPPAAYLQQQPLDDDDAPQSQAPARSPAPSSAPDHDAAYLKKRILSQVSSTPVDIDALAVSCEGSMTALQGALLELELDGQVRRLPGNKIGRIH